MGPWVRGSAGGWVGKTTAGIEPVLCSVRLITPTPLVKISSLRSRKVKGATGRSN